MNENNEYRPDSEKTPEERQDVVKNDVYGTEFREYVAPPVAPQVQENRYTYEPVKLDPDKPKSLGFSIASLVLGILSMVMCCLVYVSPVLGILAVVFAILSKKHLGYFNTMSILGLIFGIFGFIFGVIAIACSLLYGDLFRTLFEGDPSGGNGDITNFF